MVALQPWSEERVSRTSFWARPVVVPAVALVVAIALAGLLLLPAWQDPTRVAVGDGVDARQFMWMLGWWAHVVGHPGNPFLTNYADYPAGVNLLWNTSIALAGILLTPVTLVFGVVAAYNTLATLGVALSAWAAFVAIRRYAPHPAAAAVGGLIYGFSPYMMAQLYGHANLFLAFLPPVFLLILDELVVRQRRSALVLGGTLGVVAAAQLLLGEEILATSAITGIFAIVILASTNPVEVRRKLPFFVKGAVAAVVSFLILAGYPLITQFFGPQHVFGSLQPINRYVTDLVNFILPTKVQWLAPAWLDGVADRYTGNLTEWNGYLGFPLLGLLGLTVQRLWKDPVVRLAGCVGLLMSGLSLGITLHLGGHILLVPAVALVPLLPLLRRWIPAKTMALCWTVGWMALTIAPVLRNVLPARLMLYTYLMVGIMLACLLDHAFRAGRSKYLPTLAFVGLALVSLAPRLPYVSTPTNIPYFFQSPAVQQIPLGSIALIAPYSHGDHATAMAWQAASGFRFRMPEGYLFTAGNNDESPPASATQDVLRSLEGGAPLPISDETSSRLRSDLRSWGVKTVIVGPMAHEDKVARLYADLLGRTPCSVGGVWVWWHVDGGTPGACASSALAS